MRSRFSINGHPMHPLFVVMPIGLMVWAFAAIVIYLFRDYDTVWYQISYWTAIAGVLTALPAALLGFGDYLTIALHSEARSIATAHMLLNLVTVLLFAIAAYQMRDAAATEGMRLTAVVALQGVGAGLLMLSGVLGGEMVYRHHLAVIPEDDEVARAEQQRHRERPHPAR